MAFSVFFFKTTSGNEPVLEWIRSLSATERAVIGADLRTVQMGFPLGMPLCKPVGFGLYEVRSSLPTRREARLFFFLDGQTLIIVAGFIKKSRKAPKLELDTARDRKLEYERNKTIAEKSEAKKRR